MEFDGWNAEYWAEGQGITVGQLCRYLQENVPASAVLNICGADTVCVNLSNNRHYVSLDYDDLSDLPEYEGREAKRIE